MRKTCFLMPFLIFAFASSAALSAADYATEAYVDDNVMAIIDYVDGEDTSIRKKIQGMAVDDRDLYNNQLTLRDMLNRRDENKNWVTLDTEEQFAIPAINELHAEMAGKQDAITAKNPLPAENVSGLAEVAKTGSYESLTDKPEFPSTENLATKEELQAVQAVVGNSESGLVMQVAENTAAIAGKADKSALETAIADLDEKIDQAVIDSSNIDLSSYAKTEDVAKTYATQEVVNAITAALTDKASVSDVNLIEGRVDVLEEAGYQTAAQVKQEIAAGTAGFVKEADLTDYAKTADVDAELVKKVSGVETVGSYLVNFDAEGNVSYAPIKILDADGNAIALTTNAVAPSEN